MSAPSAVVVSAHSDTVTPGDLAVRYERRRAELAAKYGQTSPQVHDLTGRYARMLEHTARTAIATAPVAVEVVEVEDPELLDADLTAILVALDGGAR